MPDNVSHSSDNFALLVEIKTKLERVIQDVSKLNDTLVQDITGLQTSKADKAEVDRMAQEGTAIHEDFELRIRELEESKWKIVGIAIAFSTIIAIAGVFVTLLA